MKIDGPFAYSHKDNLYLENGDVIVLHPQKDRYRPCYVYNAAEDREVKAIFHEWQFNSKDQLCGIVEFENGQCGLYSVSRIRFVDTDRLIGEWKWPDLTSDRI